LTLKIIVKEEKGDKLYKSKVHNLDELDLEIEKLKKFMKVKM
jgi:hypothetical protein